uniref:Uncharacterized protein n=1 Tax=Romanomermis culicivorax TaxID=13658 RepID=A0A915IRP0_ROMCU
MYEVKFGLPNSGHEGVQQPRKPGKLLTRIGAWNVRALFQCARRAQLLKEFDCYWIEILGISEVCWTNSGRMISNGKTITYLGHSSEHQNGVAIILSQAAAALV